MASLEQVWSTIDATLKKVSPRAAATLRKPATDKALAALEQALKVKLPADLRTLLSLHDGQDEKKRLPVLFAKTTWFLLPAASIVSTYESLNELDADGEFDDLEGTNQDGLVKPLWWSDAWIPFATNAAGDSLCVDAGPTRRARSANCCGGTTTKIFASARPSTSRPSSVTTQRPFPPGSSWCGPTARSPIRERNRRPQALVMTSFCNKATTM